MKTKKFIPNYDRQDTARSLKQLLSATQVLPTPPNSHPPHTSHTANVDTLETSTSLLQPENVKPSEPSPWGRGQGEGEIPFSEAANIRSCIPHPASGISSAPTFRSYLLRHARVPARDTRHGAYVPFTFTGRAPLDFIVTLIDKILANCLHNETVEIDGVTFPGAAGALGAGPACPATLKGATLTVGGGAQFGKTVLILNFQAFATFIEFINFGYYTPDQELLAKIVDTKFRPDVIDQQPWMAEMVHFSRAQNASGKSVDRKNSYQVSKDGHKSFGHFCGMQKPPTTISLDAAALDEVDDIPPRNMGYVDGRMTGSRLQLKFEIGTQRIAGAGQNARLKAGTYHVMMYECPNCHSSWNLEEEFPRCIRIREAGRDGALRRPPAGKGPAGPTHVDPQETSTAFLQPTPTDSSSKSYTSHPTPTPPESPAHPTPSGIPHPASGIVPTTPDPVLTPETPHDRSAHYYTACPNCATPLDRDSGRYLAKNPHRLAEAHFSIRVSQLNISAISLNEIVAAWYSALSDPSGAALAAFHCDRLAMPNAGAAQPLTQTILDHSRTLGLAEHAETPHPYDMTFGPLISQNVANANVVGRVTPCAPPNVEQQETSTASLEPENMKPSEPSPRGRGQGEGELTSRAATNIPSTNPLIQQSINPPEPSTTASPNPQSPTNPSEMTREQLIQACLEAEATLKTLEMRETLSTRKSISPTSAFSVSPRFSPRFAGLDTGPRCWFWCDELRSESLTACVWAELIASGIAPTRIPQLMRDLGITCLFIDAGGEPDLTKRLVLNLNGLDNYRPPNKPRADILRMRLTNIGTGGQGNIGSGSAGGTGLGKNCHGQGLAWDGEKAQWTGLRAAAVLFVSGEAKGIEQTIGFTQDGKIYPLIKCNRRESIQTTVNDFLTPESGVYELVDGMAFRGGASVPASRGPREGQILRTLPRARLPLTYRGTGVSQSLLDSHLLNLRKERDPITGEENWIDNVENHLGLAKVYARLATLATSRPQTPAASATIKTPWSTDRIGSMGLGKATNHWPM